MCIRLYNILSLEIFGAKDTMSLARRTSARHAREELRGLIAFNGVLVKMSDEKEALAFFHENPTPLRDFLASFGLEYNPGAKSIENIVKRTDLLEAWATLYDSIYRNPAVVKKMVANLRRKYGSRFAELPPSSPLALQEGGEPLLRAGIVASGEEGVGAVVELGGGQGGGDGGGCGRNTGSNGGALLCACGGAGVL